MVQKKVAQKAKVKSAPESSTAALKTSKRKPAKPVVLTNGYEKKSKPTESDKTSSTEDNAEQTVAVESEEHVELSKPGTSKASSIESDKAELLASKENVEAKPENIQTETVPKSRKRKLYAPDTDNIQTLVKSRTKAKKQKGLLEVPPLKSIIGKVFVVGENDVGQLGLNEDVDSKERPFLLDLPYPIVDVAAGGMHSVCLTENGEVLTFGCNDEGALGRVTKEEEERIPRRINIPEKIVQVSAGDSHSAALAESGQVYVWGNFRNGEGQMGLTPDGNKSIVPIKVLSHVTIVKIASGGDHLVCLSNEGIVYTCGCGEQGQLGRINPRSCRDGGRKGLAMLLEPAPVDKLMRRTPINDVWTESYATFLKAQENGSIYAFGLNNYNQLGCENKSNEQEFQMKFFPESITSFNNRNWQQINGGQHHTLALDTEGLVYSLGRKDYGRLGLGEDCQDVLIPTVIPTLQNEKCNSVSSGNCVSFAVTQDGTLYSWGMGSSQLGHGDDDDIHAPRLIKGELMKSWEVFKVSGGGQHALILACPKKSSSQNKT